MRIYELFENSLVGTTVYHGTNSGNAVSILKSGLHPRPNRWLDKYADKHAQPSQSAKDNAGIYTTPSLENAMQWNQKSSGYLIVFAFDIIDSDIIKDIGKYTDDEIIIGNKIDPSRLRVVYPEDFDTDKFRNRATASLNKTAIIRQLNIITKQHGFKVRSGSKTTDRVLVYDLSDDEPGRYVSYSFRMQEYLDFLKDKVPTKVFQKIQDIVGT